MGRYISTTGTASSVIRNVSTTFSATVNDRILANSSGGTFTITLPLNSTLLVNDVVQIVDVTGSFNTNNVCLLYTSPSPRDVEESRMPSSA